MVLRGPNVFPNLGQAPHCEGVARKLVSSGDIARATRRAFLQPRPQEEHDYSGGRTYPSSIERVLFAHPEVAEERVIGRADRHAGSAVAMWAGAERECDARALEAHLLTQLARFKVPHEYFSLCLPRNAYGNVQHSDFARWIAERTGARTATASSRGGRHCARRS